MVPSILKMVDHFVESGKLIITQRPVVKIVPQSKKFPCVPFYCCHALMSRSKSRESCMGF